MATKLIIWIIVQVLTNDSEALKFVVYQNSSWSIQTALASYNLGGFGNMVLDSKGYPHFICRQHLSVIEDTIVYASWNGASWTTQAVVSNVQLEVNIATRGMGFLSLDSHDYPHITYCTSGREVMYASWTGTAWNIQAVDSNISALYPGYLAVDPNGNPHVSYLGIGPDQSIFGPSATMMYATATEPTPIFTPSHTPTSSPTAQASPTFSTSALLLVLTVLIIVAIVTIAVYFWKKTLS